MDCTVHKVAKSQTQLSKFHFHITISNPGNPPVSDPLNNILRTAISWKTDLQTTSKSNLFHFCGTSNMVICWKVGIFPSFLLDSLAGLVIQLTHDRLTREKQNFYFVHKCTCAKSIQSCPTLCSPVDYAPRGSSVKGFPRQEHWSGLPFPSLGDLPDPEIEPASLAPLALAGGFLTTSAAWEAPFCS